MHIVCDHAKFIGATDDQVKFGANADPRIYLTKEYLYEIETLEEHSWHTKVVLKMFPKLKFNSVHFEFVHKQIHDMKK